MKNSWFSYVLLIGLAVFVLSGCGGTAPLSSNTVNPPEESIQTDVPKATFTPEPTATATATIPPTPTFASSGAPLLLSPVIQPPQTPITTVNGGQLVKLGTWETIAGCDYMYCALAISPDGRLLAVSSMAEGATAGVYLYDLQESRGLWLLEGESAPALVFAPDSSFLVDGNGQVWDVRSGEPTMKISGIGDENEVWRLAIAGDGSLVAANTKDGLQVWDLTTGAARTILKLQNNGIFAMAVSAYGSKVVVSHSKISGYNPKGDLLVLDTRGESTTEPLASYTFKAYWGSSLAYSPDEKYIAAGTTEGRVVILDSSTLAEVTWLEVDYEFWVTGLAYSTDGKMLVAGEQSFIKLFNTDDYSELIMLDASGSFEDFFTFTIDSKSIFMISAQMDTVTIEWFGIP